jgi:trehalose 6-phosphate phosphatase
MERELKRIAQRIPVSGKVLMVLDKDGTLDSFVADPGKAFTPANARHAIQSLSASGVDVAILSGRSVSQLKALIGVLKVMYLGQHGSEKFDGNSATYERRPSPNLGTKVDELENLLKRRLVEGRLSCAGVLLERKGESLAVHWRQAPELAGQAERVFNECVSALDLLNDGDFVLQTGSMVLELKPGAYDKGIAVKELVGDADYLHIMCAGDDQTDLHMMEAVERSGIPSTMIIVGNRIDFPGAIRLPTPEDMQHLLCLLARERLQAL